MPKLTKQYWAHWQGNDPERPDDERPTAPRAAVKPPEISAAGLAAGKTTRLEMGQPEPTPAQPERRVVDPAKTIIDQVAPRPVRGNRSLEDGWTLDETVVDRAPSRPARARSPRPSTNAPAPQESQAVTQGNDPKNQPPAGTSLVRRADSAVSRNLPTITVTSHGFGNELVTDERLILLREPDSDRAAAFRVLRHQVVRQGDPQVIVVSSALPEEGKTTTAINLAMALAECGRARVLLAEMNFTRPCLSHIFRFTPPWCFVEQIIEHRTNSDLAWSVVAVPPHGLHVAAADLRTEKRQLFDAPAFAFAIDQMRQAGYDYIVLDAPSVLGSAEVNMLQDSADGVLLVVRGTSSHRKELRSCIEQLAPETILGVTLLQS